jgi:hypothetical protein
MSDKHAPRDWFTRGMYPSCSCGFAPRDNRKLIEHWAGHGIRWVSEQGKLVAHPAHD